MTIAKIRKGNRITIPVEEMHKKQLSEGDEVYFDLIGKVGRDVTFTTTTANSGYNPQVFGPWSTATITYGTLPWNSY